MKILTLLLAMLGPVSLWAHVDRDALIDAIGIVETGGRAQIGAHGERGVYQLTPAVRRIVGGEDRDAALRWLDLLETRLMANHIDLNPFNIALAYNGGVGGLVRGRAPMASYDYALRVTTMYRLILAQRPPISYPPHRFILTDGEFRVSFNP